MDLQKIAEEAFIDELQKQAVFSGQIYDKMVNVENLAKKINRKSNIGLAAGAMGLAGIPLAYKAGKSKGNK